MNAAPRPPDTGARTFAFTFGTSETQRIWGDRRRLSWPALTELLTKHKRGRKEGSCIVPAIFRGTRRIQAEADQIDLIVLDADCGHTLEEIETAVTARGWACIIHSTHSHLTMMTTAKKSHWDKFSEANPAGDARGFLIGEKHYLPRVAEGARIGAVNGVEITFKHQPCPKFRIVLPLSRPWRAPDYASQDAANAAWKERIDALAAALGLSHDQSCVDANRLFYLPRHPGDGREPVARVIDGADCDIWTLPTPAAPVQTGGLFAAKPTTAPDAGEYTDPQTGEITDLRQWARSHGKRFEIVKALQARAPAIFVGHVADGTKHHIHCPNEDAHTTTGADRATFIVNASEADNKGFAVHCRHAHCTGQDRLFFLRRMLEREWMTVDDLTSAEFLTAEDDADRRAEEPPPHPGPEAEGTGERRKGAGWRASAGDWGGEGPPDADAEWPEPLDFLDDAELTGAPELRPEHLPEAIVPFVFDAATRMGVDPAAVALAALVSLASVMSDDWRIQPKAYDDTWTENPRLWGAIVGDPSMLKTPILRATTAPIDRLEAEARERHEGDVRDYKCDLKAWKDAGSDPAAEPKHPRLGRFMVEGTTTEALSEALRDDAEAKQRAPAKKVLVRLDEMSEWVGSFDCYRAGGRGGADRGAYLRLFNGGRYTIDRVNRGAFAISNWSACILGGIQPEPIRKIAKDAADDGLLQRFCYCVPARQGRGEDRCPDTKALARYAALFPALTALQPASNTFGAPQRAVVLHAEAHAHRLEILDLAEALAAMPDASNRLKSALGKFPGLWARLVLVFHLIERADVRARGEAALGDGTNVVHGAAIMATCYMRDILLPHLLRAEALMFATVQTGHARWIAGFILSQGQPRVAARDIVRAYGALRAPEHRRELLDVMASLEAMSWVAPQMQPDGRAPVAWYVNPKVHTGFADRAKRERADREATKARIRETLARHMRTDGAA